MNIATLLRLAEDFEEASPITLPAGAIPEDMRQRSAPPIEEEDIKPSTRSLFKRNLTGSNIKELLLKFNQIHMLSEGAARILHSMNRNIIFNKDFGIDDYIERIGDIVVEIMETVGDRSRLD